ncbi:pyrroline-5-carboxylate reductase [Halolactibacillus alkaliphilus]|uniref:Pyrroline-5-carboxylate reductase n=1 Tax=Halolactibacillus alkaliphilus TaxID=442899 RepID=A0A511X3F5_9BACI|nr:pyrroline-5-carboxylate reductase [Halolactibacillus alkaliphilus]GEN57478.1 pyrroline-5-carboxylate reductase [Halolactibacillus alkaliphilus]GGN74002.1 pyrroline-5-carboxylate reductase [Halolactibacillus alkaliphilus]SFO99786.1 pyrroline-5-carboxylate reductase [Halolactibacillus alkaliphilus]
MATEKILMIGAGRMAQAIINGLMQADFNHILVGNNGNAQRLEEVESRFGVRTTNQWQNHVSDQDIIILAVPPEAHEEVLTALGEVIDGQLVLTVAAGIDVTYLESRLPEGTPVSWLMPNTAAAKGESMTLFTLGKYVTDEHEYYIEKILFSIGQFKKLTEEQVHRITPITGSGPAFVYRLADVLIKEVQKAGVTEVVAKQLIAQMVKGSSVMLTSDLKCPQDLMDEVATPGGVTEKGLQVFDDHHFDDMIKEAIRKCVDHATRDE